MPATDKQLKRLKSTSSSTTSRNKRRRSASTRNKMTKEEEDIFKKEVDRWLETKKTVPWSKIGQKLFGNRFASNYLYQKYTRTLVPNTNPYTWTKSKEIEFYLMVKMYSNGTRTRWAQLLQEQYPDETVSTTQLTNKYKSLQKRMDFLESLKKADINELTERINARAEKNREKCNLKSSKKEGRTRPTKRKSSLKSKEKSKRRKVEDYDESDEDACVPTTSTTQYQLRPRKSTRKEVMSQDVEQSEEETDNDEDGLDLIQVNDASKMYVVTNNETKEERMDKSTDCEEVAEDIPYIEKKPICQREEKTNQESSGTNKGLVLEDCEVESFVNQLHRLRELKGPQEPIMKLDAIPDPVSLQELGFDDSHIRHDAIITCTSLEQDQQGIEQEGQISEQLGVIATLDLDEESDLPDIDEKSIMKERIEMPIISDNFNEDISTGREWEGFAWGDLKRMESEFDQLELEFGDDQAITPTSSTSSTGFDVYY